MNKLEERDRPGIFWLPTQIAKDKYRQLHNDAQDNRRTVISLVRQLSKRLVAQPLHARRVEAWTELDVPPALSDRVHSSLFIGVNNIKAQ